MASALESLARSLTETGRAISSVASSVLLKDVRLECTTNKQLTVEAWRTDQPIVPSIGYGGHPVGARPKKKALTIWEGRQPFQISVPLLLYHNNESVESERVTLEEIATGTDSTQPLSVRFLGESLPIPPTIGNNWWIEDMSWGEEVRRKKDWALTFKLVTVTLLERVDDEVLASSTQRSRTPNGQAVVRHYTVKKGDTLTSIAARELLDKNRWTDIAALNGLRSSGNLKVGLVLTLP